MATLTLRTTDLKPTTNFRGFQSTLRLAGTEKAPFRNKDKGPELKTLTTFRGGGLALP